MRNKSTFLFITVLMSLLVIYSFVVNVIMPVTKNPIPSALFSQSKKEELKDTKKKKTTTASKEEPIPDSLKTNNSHKARVKLLELKKREKFLQSQIKLINDDSTYLVLDLNQKKAILKLKGVSLHECEILKSRISSSIKDQPEEALLSWLGEPFYLDHDSASIPKISFIEKIAPKDTIEAAKIETTPAPPKRGDVYIVMDFTKNLRLIIKQDEKPDKEGKKRINALKRNFIIDEISKSVKALIHLDRDPAIPTIEIVLPKSDATILYRALPYKPKVIVSL